MTTGGKLAANCDNFVTVRPKVQQLIPKCHKLTANSQSTLELETEEWVSG